MAGFAGPDTLRLSRSGVKMSVPPEGMPRSMREDYMRMLGSEAAYFDAAMRPGCTHIVATALTEVRPSRHERAISTYCTELPAAVNTALSRTEALWRLGFRRRSEVGRRRRRGCCAEAENGRTWT